MTKTFTMHVAAGTPGNPGPSWTRLVPWDGETPPQLLHLTTDPDHQGFYVRQGRMLSSGDHYAYHRAEPVDPAGPLAEPPAANAPAHHGAQVTVTIRGEARDLRRAMDVVRRALDEPEFDAPAPSLRCNMVRRGGAGATLVSEWTVGDQAAALTPEVAAWQQLLTTVCMGDQVRMLVKGCGDVEGEGEIHFGPGELGTVASVSGTDPAACSVTVVLECGVVNVFDRDDPPCFELVQPQAHCLQLPGAFITDCWESGVDVGHYGGKMLTCTPAQLANLLDRALHYAAGNVDQAPPGLVRAAVALLAVARRLGHVPSPESVRRASAG